MISWNFGHYLLVHNYLVCSETREKLKNNAFFVVFRKKVRKGIAIYSCSIIDQNLTMIKLSSNLGITQLAVPSDKDFRSCIYTPISKDNLNIFF